MEKADSCRRAAAEAVADVEPPQLHDYIESVLDRASMVPAALTLESAAAMASEGRVIDDGQWLDGEPDADRALLHDDHGVESVESEPDGVVTHAAGVQLIYEGLRLTRALAHDEPWTVTDADADADTDPDAGDGDLAILAADILVARGFYLLARTDAAGKAVRTVRSFGRNQTSRTDLAAGEGADADVSTADPEPVDATLERDVLELAVLTGAVAVGETPSPRLLSIAEQLADDAGPSFPPAEECLADLERSLPDHSLEDHTTDRATSATDP
ncbi:DUF7114 family protein [Natrinema salifodinae]|uniref:Uncharacterized protein n=1 Tax=Natrinema salifodinae TaxID=1202768 RepID=A0A1I0Q800_9EURY|nr:hypothetical protein [Natrinema salifodinae]SEW22919.1 hypothetical protein SAMN05216285_3193 [Natrinema salifodinae]